MRRRAIGVLAASAAIALGAAGCGGDDEDGSSSESAAAPLSKEEFIAQADQICTDGNTAIDEAGQEQFASGQLDR